MARLADLFLLSQIPGPQRGRSTQPLAAVLLFLLVLLPANLAAADSSTLWTLKRIVVANGMNQFAMITNEHYDASGGEVDVSADGRALDLCSGGFERFHFMWRFPQRLHL